MSFAHQSLMAALNMGHYGAYVWSAYGLTAMVFLLNLISVQSQRHQINRRLRQWFKGQ